MSKVVSGIGDAFKSVHKFSDEVIRKVSPLSRWIKKGLKKMWGTTIGRIVIIAVAIYLGGWALGQWAGPGGAAAGQTSGQVLAGANVPGQAVASAAGADAAAATGAGTLSTGGAGQLGALNYAGAAGAQGAAAAQTAAGTTTAGTLANAAAQGGVAAEGAGQVKSANAIVQTIQSLGRGVKGAVVGTTPGKAGGILGFLEQHPVAGLAAMQGLAAATAKTPEEIQKDAEKRYNANMRVANVNVGTPRPPGHPLVRMNGMPVYGPTGTLTDSQVA